jgi:transcriptional regulator with XRE-family HTH domain
MKIGELIYNARIQKGWSLRQLEERSGVGNVVIWQIENGQIKSTSFSNTVKIAKALKLKLTDLAKMV